MQKLLIAEYDEAMSGALTDLLRHSFDITVCSDGATALELIRTMKPDALLLDLMLPVMDGFYILEQTMDCRPPIVLCVCDFCNDYVSQTLRDLNIIYVVRKPCLPRVIVSRLEHLASHTPATELADGQTITANLLLQFRFDPKKDGFRFLKIGVPLYAQDPQQRVCKELYATIADICGAGSWNHVERSIRSAIEAAWTTGAPAWEQYFPGCASAPTGKSFISRLVQILMDY